MRPKYRLRNSYLNQWFNFDQEPPPYQYSLQQKVSQTITALHTRAANVIAKAIRIPYLVRVPGLVRDFCPRRLSCSTFGQRHFSGCCVDVLEEHNKDVLWSHLLNWTLKRCQILIDPPNSIGVMSVFALWTVIRSPYGMDTHKKGRALKKVQTIFCARQKKTRPGLNIHARLITNFMPGMMFISNSEPGKGPLRHIQCQSRAP